MVKKSKRSGKLRESQDEGHVVDYPVALVETLPVWEQRKKLIDGFMRIKDALEQCNGEVADYLRELLVGARLIDDDTKIVFKVVGDKVRVFRKKSGREIEGTELTERNEQDVATAAGQQAVDSAPSIVSARHEAETTENPSETSEETPLVRLVTKR